VKKRFNIIYKAKNEQQKCFYVGYSAYGLSIRKDTHERDCFKRKLKTKFYNFIRKYGWDSFDWEILAVYSTPEELPPAEINWILEQKKEFSDWVCLNSTNGGEGSMGRICKISTKKKISKSKKKYFKNSENKITGVRHHHFKQHPTKETIELMKKARKIWLQNHPKYSEEQSKRMKKVFKKKKQQVVL
jgi:hypothetical protein